MSDEQCMILMICVSAIVYLIVMNFGFDYIALCVTALIIAPFSVLYLHMFLEFLQLKKNKRN